MKLRIPKGLRALYNWQQEAESLWRGTLGLPFSIGLDSSAAIASLSWVAIDVVNRWLKDQYYWGTLGVAQIVKQFPLRCLGTAAFVLFWIFVLGCWIRYMRRPFWWAIPYVWILCPAAWLSAKVIPIFAMHIVILLQLPIVICSVRRARARIRANSS
jgi:hypothetical protein